ncbi:GntR family transcriptional regulator [Microbacterium dextranolyticum]|uniref:GntR family transcriptional regulator n=1 Tax=Microbacterium dextranolyticum TaxID=36806 RepID=A0A9W6HLM0_9MICO|nr:GntR family transcriptional regulator [Microbacterium dextranolyticum]MBM7464017.1 DNA-binding GntR family transcriptional regulator [Microbacterium dextranolyticum]GLJ95097.1 GntR family transcriptional regulator [Microbacterium dextranolyticum]
MNQVHAEASAADAAYAKVKERILDGDLPGGTMISEGTIADELGISRTPVREAFLRLQAEGWMRLYPKRGALIREIAPRELDDIVEARILIETDAVRRLVREPSRVEDVVADLRDILEEQRQAYVHSDLSRLAEADTAFHARIVAAGGNALLSEFFATLRDRQRRMLARSLWRRDERAEQVLADHELLIRLIADRDETAFEVGVGRHIRTTHREILK